MAISKKRLEVLQEIRRENGLDLETAHHEERTGPHAAWLEELRPRTLQQILSENNGKRSAP